MTTTQTNSLDDQNRASSLSFWSTTTAGLLAASSRDLLNDLVVDMGVRNNYSASAVAKLDGDRRALFVVGDLLGRKVADEDSLTSHLLSGLLDLGLAIHVRQV